MAASIPDLDKVVDDFVREVRRVAEQAALEVLQSQLAAVVPGKARPPSAGRPAKAASGRRSADSIDATKSALLALIAKEPGQRFEQIRTALRRPRTELQLPLRKLVTDGAVKAKGVKRGTRYYPVVSAR